MNSKILKGPRRHYTPTSTVGQFFFHLAQKFQNRICHIDAESEQEETYFSVNQRSVRVALSMLKRGITSKDVITTCASLSLDAPIPTLATFYLGATVANLDPSLSVRQTAHLLSLVSPRIIFVEESCVYLIEESLEFAKLQTEIVVIGESKKYTTFSSFTAEQVEEKEFRPLIVDLEETALMCFSSGSTGLPKAVCYSNKSLLYCFNYFFQSGCCYDTFTTFFSLYCMTTLLFLGCSFKVGGRRILCGFECEPKKLFRYIEKYKIMYINIDPYSSYELTSFPDYHKYDTSSLTTIFTGGTAMSASQFHRVCDVFKHANVILAYGLSECGLVSAFNPETDQHLIQTKIGSSGKPNVECLLKIVDIQTRELLGPNQKGEIYFKSLSLMTRYKNIDCSQVFDEEGFFRTGDIGFYDEDECVYIVDRVKEMFKYSSYTIIPSAIEAVLLEHPNVKQAVVFGLPGSEKVGEVPAACVVLEKDIAVKAEEIQDFVAAKVSDSEKLRGGVYFLKELPRLPSGKLKRKEMRHYIIDLLKKKNTINV